MTEAEWLECEEPERMLETLPRTTSVRRRRLFACACCREKWRLLGDERSRSAVEVAERHADGLAGADDMAKAVVQAMEVARERRRLKGYAAHAASWAASWTIAKRPVNEFESRAADFVAEAGKRSRKTLLALADLVRDVFRWRPKRAKRVVLPRSPEASAIALAAYEERELPSGRLDNARLAVLSDALEEAGCTEEAVLSHLRSPGTHVRGCWALDLVLGKR